MVYQTIKSDMCPGHRFADRSPAEFHPNVLYIYGIAKTGTFALAVRMIRLCQAYGNHFRWTSRVHTFSRKSLTGNG